ncbi:MAG: hypothetical protein CVV52_12215, partial [Spirochaetae bacterium HGW-Spirochaetae-8]
HLAFPALAREWNHQDASFPLASLGNEKSTLEMDFFVKDFESSIPIEVKANDGATASLNKLIDKQTYRDIKYGIKLGQKNIGYNGKFHTSPYFLTFLLKRFLKERVR